MPPTLLITNFEDPATRCVPGTFHAEFTNRIGVSLPEFRVPSQPYHVPVLVILRVCIVNAALPSRLLERVHSHRARRGKKKRRFREFQINTLPTTGAYRTNQNSNLDKPNVRCFLHWSLVLYTADVKDTEPDNRLIHHYEFCRCSRSYSRKGRGVFSVAFRIDSPNRYQIPAAVCGGKANVCGKHSVPRHE